MGLYLPKRNLIGLTCDLAKGLGPYQNEYSTFKRKLNPGMG